MDDKINEIKNNLRLVREKIVEKGDIFFRAQNIAERAKEASRQAAMFVFKVAEKAAKKAAKDLSIAEEAYAKALEKETLALERETFVTTAMETAKNELEKAKREEYELEVAHTVEMEIIIKEAIKENKILPLLSSLVGFDKREARKIAYERMRLEVKTMCELMKEIKE